MEFIPTSQDILLAPFLFGLLLCTISFLRYELKHKSRPTYEPHSSFDLACLLEDAPSTSLRGQSYQLAIPLMTPLACLWEDAPSTSLRGQSYQLAIPLISPLACLLEDAPSTSLKGQSYQLAIPLMTPLACIVTRTWHNFYRQNLGLGSINYWQWKDKPESRNICQELSLLLDLPEAKGYAKDVLESLVKHKDKFAHQDFRVQTQMRVAFKEWHDTALGLIGKDSLKAIYKVCYGTEWEICQKLISKELNEAISDESEAWWKVLGVNPKANPSQIEAAYKKRIRLWHPDINKNPHATQMTSRINVAYEQYKSIHRSSCVENEKSDQD